VVGHQHLPLTNHQHGHRKINLLVNVSHDGWTVNKPRLGVKRR
jgi:hypothetical protein